MYGNGMLDAMLYLFDALPLYDTADTSNIHAELAAYAAGLELLQTYLDALLGELFPQTARDQGLRLREQAYALSSYGETEERRARLLERSSKPAGTYHEDWVNERFAALAGDAALVQSGRTLCLTGAGAQDWPVLGPTGRFLIRVTAPYAHCILPGAGKAFDSLDGLERTWNAWDHTGLPFDYIDTLE
ncbi:MAG: YmfQ family protein [Clostridiales bacterium]|nr:YmfQ family protein [Clostridiales bacterium]